MHSGRKLTNVLTVPIDCTTPRRLAGREVFTAFSSLVLLSFSYETEGERGVVSMRVQAFAILPSKSLRKTKTHKRCKEPDVHLKLFSLAVEGIRRHFIFNGRDAHRIVVTRSLEKSHGRLGNDMNKECARSGPWHHNEVYERLYSEGRLLEGTSV